jgi:hypothetical protein
MFRLIAIDFFFPHFSLLSPTSPCEFSEREVTSPSNLKVVGALDNYSLVFVFFINFFGQLKDWVGQVLFFVSCPKGQVEKYVNVEAWRYQNNGVGWRPLLLCNGNSSCSLLTYNRSIFCFNKSKYFHFPRASLPWPWWVYVSFMLWKG